MRFWLQWMAQKWRSSCSATTFITVPIADVPCDEMREPSTDETESVSSLTVSKKICQFEEAAAVRT
jgi:hypothetical protein